MVMRRARAAVGNEILPDICQLQNRLADAETALTDMTAELASSYESLVALFRYSSELGAHADLKDFSHRLLKDLMQIAEADCAVLRLISPDGKKLETLQALPGGEFFSLPRRRARRNCGLGGNRRGAQPRRTSGSARRSRSAKMIPCARLCR